MATTGLPSMDSYPTVDALVSGMQGLPGVTEKWDMVVSYSLDSLNSLLVQLWNSHHPTTGGTIVLVSENQDEDGETYHIEWSLRLGSPSLRFTYDGRAELTMGLSGTYKTVEKSADGKERPTRTIPENTYVLVANVPLEFVHATGTGTGTDAASHVKQANPEGAPYVSFDDDPNAALHVVFSFDTTTEQGASYRVESINKDHPPPTAFSRGLAGELAAWMSNPANFQAINYSLAVVQKKPIPGVMYLVPQNVTFSVYAKPAQEKVGCLSLYIKTQDSGNEPGRESRRFQLPKKDLVDTYPIPDGYTASIIIRHDLFANKFLRDTLVRSKSDDNNDTFREVNLRGDSEVGFALDMRINSRGMGKFSTKDYWGGLDVDSIDWDFGRDLLSLVVDPRTNAVWHYHFEDRLSWERDSRWWGKTYYDLNLNKTAPLVAEYSDVGLAGRLELTHGDWVPWVHEWNPDIWERARGGTSDIPDIVRNGLLSFHLPAFQQDLQMQYFAATNLFGPGKHMISVAGEDAIWMPYDVLILGHLLAPLESPTPTTVTARVESVSARVENAAARGAPTRPTTTAGSTTTDFVLGLSAGQPILQQTVNALQTGDEKTIDDFLAHSGYDITADGLRAALQTSRPGPGFDIRHAGGAYSFQEPTDLRPKSMSVDPTTGRVYIGGIYTGNSTDDRGVVVWDMSGFHYEIQFTISYADDDTPKPTTFSGSRRPSHDGDKDSVTAVSGTQLTDSQPSSFVNDPPAATAAWVLGLAGGGFTFLVYFLDKYRANRKKNLQKQAENLRNGLSRADAALNAKAAAAAEDGFKKMNLEDFRVQVEEKVRASVKTSMDANKPVDEVGKDAAAAAKEQVKNFATEYLKSNITSDLGRFKNVLGKFIVDRAVGTAIAQAVDARSGRFNADGSYMVAITGAEIARYTVEAKEAAARTVTDDLARVKMAATEEFEKLRRKKEARDDYVEEKKKEGVMEDDLKKNDAQYRSLADEIARQEDVFMEAEKAVETRQNESDKVGEEKKEAVEEEKRAREHADKVAEETFKGKP
ncbi:hypothetical protein ACRALDRAFT_1061388 [Sodiomyces alcalophilus JCM 7366]|uniref:uncharacterized protein n=1 Tax=Sodiomyces alcalophilus JCM 7366 TaxID=591952 RepID=UPI0039B4BD49